MNLSFKNDPIFSLHYNFLRFIVFLNIIFYKEEFLISDDYKIWQYLEENSLDLLFSLESLIIEWEEIYYTNLESINLFVEKYQKKNLDIEDLCLDFEPEHYKKLVTEYSLDIENNKTLKSLSQLSSKFYMSILGQEKVELKKFIVFLNTSLDDKVFNDFVTILKTHYKEEYSKKET